MTTPFRCFVMGNESLLVQCSELLLEAGHRILGVITRDTDIEDWAESKSLRTIKPGKRLVESIGDEPFDWFFSIANLSIIPDEILAKPANGAINFHDGPLPRYAGLNAPSWALMSGERTHGISWHIIEGGVDEGDILEQRIFELTERETALTLNTRCYELGIESFGAMIEKLGRGEIDRRTQDLSQRTYFKRHQRPMGASTIDWEQPAHRIDAQVRALDYGGYPNPIGVPMVVSPRGDLLVLPSVERAADSVNEAPGTILAIDSDGLEVATQTGSLLFPRVLCAEGLPLTADAAARYGLEVGANLRVSPEARGALGDLDAALAPHEAFWTKRLSTLDEAQLPQVDRSVQSDDPRDGGKPPRVTRRLLEIDDNSPHTVLAGVSAWLGRVTGKLQFDVGYRHPGIAARAGGAEKLVAPFVPLRMKFSCDESFDALRARAATELEKVESKLTYPRPLYVRQPATRRPSFDLLFETGVDFEGYSLPAGVPAALVTNGARAGIVFDAERLPETAVDALRHQLQVLLGHGVHRADTSVKTLPLVDDAERQRILYEWNQTEREYPRDQGIHHLFSAQAAKTPDAPALVFQNTTLTYGELERRTNQVAHRLRSFGVGPDMPVGLCTDRSLDLVIGALGIFKAGGAYVPLDPTYPAERLAYMVESSGASVVVTQSAQHEVVESWGRGDALRQLVLDQDGEIASQPTDLPQVEGWDSSKLAYLIYTSGSTGKPKGVMVEHRNVANFFVGMDERIAQEGDAGTWLAVTSLSFDISVLELWWTLARGFKVVLSSDADRSLVSGGGTAVSKYSHRKIDFSMFYFSADEGEHTADAATDKYELLIEGAKFADENGFSAVWTPERHFHAFGGLYPNPSVTGAAIAVLTKKVKIRSGSCVAPLHHAARIAEEWSVVDNLSNGRVQLAFASGWAPNDFVLRKESFGRQKEVMVEQIDQIRRLWRGESVEFEGPLDDGAPVAVTTMPRPVQTELPFLITAAGNPETFRIAGELGGGILTHLLGQNLEEVSEKVQVYRKAWKDAGHPGEGFVALMLHTLIGPDEQTVKELVREPMKAYLRTSMAVIQKHAWSFPAFKYSAKADRSFTDNFQSLSKEDTEALLDHSFERYYDDNSLFGTPASAAEMVDRCRAIGVDEIACLIDFGAPSKVVREHLPYLNELRAATSQPQGSVDEQDYSIAAQLDRHQVTHLQCTPSMARMLVMNDEARDALGNVKHVMVGGEALPGALARDLRAATNATLTNMYGPTETTIWSSTEKAEPTEGIVPIGTPIANTQLYVLDAGLQPVPVGVPGELYIGGAGVTRGYYGRDDLTAERFVSDPFRDGGRMYRTGDEVRWRADGHLEFLGRVDHQVKVRGYRIELGEIESRLAIHPDVRETVVLAREDTAGDKRLVAYVVPRGDTYDVPALKAHLGDALPDYMVPSHFVRMDRFPLTPNKKVDRKKLPRPEVRTAASVEPVEHVAPASEIEEQIADIWKRILGLTQVGTRDNFFELGGHSLVAVQAHREIKEATGQALSVTDVFRFPTIASLAEHLGGDSSKPSAALSKSADRAAARREAKRGGAGRRKLVRRR